MNLATILTVTASVVIVVVALLNAYIANRTARRLASGTVATSAADVLWTTSQAMLTAALAENAKLAERNDKLFEIIEQRTALIQGILAVQKEDGLMLARILSTLEGGADEPASSSPVASV